MEASQVILTANLINRYLKILPSLIKVLEQKGNWNDFKTELCIDRKTLLDTFKEEHLSAPSETEDPPASLLKSNYDLAVFRWALLGLPVAEKSVYDLRASFCDTCPFWEGHCALAETANFKPWLVNEECPAGKWPASNTQVSQS